VGEKELMLIGLAIILFASLLMPILHFDSLVTFGLFLFITRVGASILESMSFIYFFKKVKTEEVTNISLFNNLGSAANAIVPLVAAIVFYFTSNLYILFYIFSAFCIYAMYKAVHIKDTL
jgi:MFS family permease